MAAKKGKSTRKLTAKKLGSSKTLRQALRKDA
jgi:hypothetical protein